MKKIITIALIVYFGLCWGEVMIKTSTLKPNPQYSRFNIMAQTVYWLDQK